MIIWLIHLDLTLDVSDTVQSSEPSVIDVRSNSDILIDKV